MIREKQQIQEEIINVIDSRYMKNFLLKYQNDLHIYDYMEIIANSPVSLEKKSMLLNHLSRLSVKKEDFKNIRTCYRTILSVLNQLYYMDNTKSCLRLLSIDTENTDSFESRISNAIPVLSYQDALRRIKKEYLYYDMDDKEISNLYFILDLYDTGKNNTFIHRYRYICNSSGEIQHFENMDFFYHRRTIRNTNLKRNFMMYFSDYKDNFLNPYQIGDILYIDCRPYLPPVYCLIFYATPEVPSDYYSIRCPYLTYEGLIVEGTIKHDDFFPLASSFFCHTYISPLFRAELCQDKIPKQYIFIKQLSDTLKSNHKLRDNIDNLISTCIEARYQKPQFLTNNSFKESSKTVYGITKENLITLIKEHKTFTTTNKGE